MMNKYLLKWIQTGLIVWLVPAAVYAADIAASGLGGVANSLLSPVSLIGSILMTAATIIGLVALFAAFAQYMQYRINPLAYPISKVVVLTIMGIVLLCFPLVYKLEENVAKVVPPPATVSGVNADHPTPTAPAVPLQNNG